MTSLVNAEFLYGAPLTGELPLSETPEIALLGRSNSGKSSLINLLTTRHKLARVSQTPGSTSEINFYKTLFNDNRTFTLLDFPGYGYAKKSKTFGDHVIKAIAKQLSNRSSIKLVCLLMDSKRLPEEAELELQEICYEYDKRFLVIATKMDRLNRKEQEKSILGMARAFNLMPGDLCQSARNASSTAIWERILLSCNLGNS